MCGFDIYPTAVSLVFQCVALVFILPTGLYGAIKIEFSQIDENSGDPNLVCKNILSISTPQVGYLSATDKVMSRLYTQLSLALLPRARPKSKSTALFKLSGSLQPLNLSYHFP